jgi:hypothetical protein
VSFDLVVLSGAHDLDADEARDAYRQLAAGADWSTVLGEDARIGQFVDALSARWPDIDTLRDDQVDASPWSNGFDVSPAHVVLNMRSNAPDAVIEFCEATALGLGLNLFDPQDGTLYSRGKEPRKATPLPEKTLICEQCGEPIAPGEPHVESPRLLHMKCLLPGLQL